MLAGALHVQRSRVVALGSERVVRRDIHRPVGRRLQVRLVEAGLGEDAAHDVDVRGRAHVARGCECELRVTQGGARAQRGERLERLERGPRENERIGIAEGAHDRRRCGR